MISAARLNDNRPLMSDLYYIERALSPFSEIRKGPVDQLLQRPLSVIVLPDRAPLTVQERTRLARWIAEGGLLVRFAGPVLARNPDALLPVRLRGGNRSFGGRHDLVAAARPGALRCRKPVCRPDDSRRRPP